MFVQLGYPLPIPTYPPRCDRTLHPPPHTATAITASPFISHCHCFHRLSLHLKLPLLSPPLPSSQLRSKVEQVSEELDTLRVAMDRHGSRESKRAAEARDREELLGRADAGRRAKQVCVRVLRRRRSRGRGRGTGMGGWGGGCKDGTERCREVEGGRGGEAGVHTSQN
mgnify:CR=1 FL=1